MSWGMVAHSPKVVDKVEMHEVTKYFDMRKEARDGEIYALGKAKAVLSGADYSLVQLHSAKALRGR